MDELPALPTLNAAAIRHFSEGWNDDGTWDDVLYLAAQFLEAQASSPYSDESMIAWHHLLLGVGNFKRPGGRILPGAPLGSYESAPAPDLFRVPRLGFEVHQNDELTWFYLSEEIKGLGVATTSTLLAAIWPSTHVIMDRRTLSAAVGLITASWGWNALPGGVPILPQSTQRLPISWGAFLWYLPTTRATAHEAQSHDSHLQLRDVERALYELDRLASRPGQTWQTYSDDIMSRVSYYLEQSF
jgi:hypothetical protein